jgi:phage terminase large subunit
MHVRLRTPQWRVFQNAARFRVLAAGRRFGKTYLALTELCRAAWGSGRVAWYIAPTYKQGKRLAWVALKKMTRDYWSVRPNESELRIELITGGRIALCGADNYDTLRGDGLDFVVLDEYASMASQAWAEVIRPALSDRRGRALFIGTPKGFNHFYDLFQNAANRPEWAAFQFTTLEGGNAAPEELESAARELDERTIARSFRPPSKTWRTAWSTTPLTGERTCRRFPICGSSPSAGRLTSM